jgi:nitroreductase
MTVLEAIEKRSSYRKEYKNITVSKDDLIKIMKAGLAAPSGCNKQTTSLIAVDDADLLRRVHAVIDPPITDSAPALICVLTQRIIAYKGKCFNIQDYSAAIQNMLLAIIELGYESCWYEGHITDTDAIGRRVADVLGVPDDYDLVCILPIGAASRPVAHVSKKPFEERAWFNGFKRKA